MSSDKRRFPRRPMAESLSLTVVSSAHLVEQGERLFCESVDVSPAGMQVIVERFIELDSRVEIWFVRLEDRRTYYLKGRVSWVEAREEGGRERFYVGLKLLPADDSDFLLWLALFEE